MKLVDRIVAVLTIFSIIKAACSSSHPPRVEYIMEEELPELSVVGDLSVYFSDARVPPGLRYELRKSSDLFLVEPDTGVILTKSVIDSEETCRYMTSCLRHLSVKVRSSINPSFYEVIEAVITILNMNDNEPKFPDRLMRILIPESSRPGSVFPLKVAEDKDGTRLEYELFGEEQNLFKIQVQDEVDGSQQLRLVQLGHLDRESRDVYSLRVLAKETEFIDRSKHGGGSSTGSSTSSRTRDTTRGRSSRTSTDTSKQLRTATLNVYITVDDVNDNSPRMDRDHYTGSVPENCPIGTEVLTVKARDPDLGLNGKVIYSFEVGTQSVHGRTFQIDNETGLVSVIGQVDYERYRMETRSLNIENVTVELTVVAADLGPNSMRTHAKVKVTILDVNDNPPEIRVISASQQPGGPQQIEENAPSGSLVSHILLKDADSGDNGLVSCSLDRATFTLHSLDDATRGYELKTGASFDREENPTEMVKVTCIDGGRPALSTTELIEVMILDVNDNAPTVTDDDIRIITSENNQPNSSTPLATITASDIDAGLNARLSYALGNSTEISDLFWVDTTGNIYASVSFDYERRQRYSLSFTVADSGVPSLSATGTFTLDIIDVNDNAPMFEHHSYAFRAQDGSPAMTSLGHVIARDSDLSLGFNQVQYSIIGSSNGASILSVDSESGIIRNLVPLDRQRESRLAVRIRAHDAADVSAYDVADVLIYIDTANDHSPVFIFPNSSTVSTIQIPRNLSVIGQRIAKLLAYDLDEDQNETLTYLIADGNENNTFRIDERNGEITINSQNSDGRTFNLEVSVCDNAANPRTATSQLYITLGDPIHSSPSGQREGRTDETAAAIAEYGLLTNSNLVTIVAVGCSVFLMLVAMVTVAICLVISRNRSVAKKHKYNCRAEADRISNGNQASGRVFQKIGEDSRVNLGEETGNCLQPVPDEPSFKTFAVIPRQKLKKGVTFDLDSRGRKPLRISEPITDSSLLMCMHNGDCALHERTSLLDDGVSCDPWCPLEYNSPHKTPSRGNYSRHVGGSGPAHCPTHQGSGKVRNTTSYFRSEPSLFCHSPECASSSSAATSPLMTSSLIANPTREGLYLLQGAGTFPGRGFTKDFNKKLSESDSGRGHSEEEEVDAVFTSGEIPLEIPAMPDLTFLRHCNKMQGSSSISSPRKSMDEAGIYSSRWDESSRGSPNKGNLQPGASSVIKLGMESNV